MVRVLEEIHKSSEKLSGSVMVTLAVEQNIWEVLRVVECDDVVPVTDVNVRRRPLSLGVSRKAR